MLLFILALEAILYTLILLASQKSSVHMYGKFLLQEKGTSTLQMRRWWGNVMFGIFICPVSWFLFLPFDLSPLHQIQLITRAVLSSVCLLREAGLWAAFLSRLSLLRTSRVWLLIAEEEPHHWEQCPEWLPTCAPACMRYLCCFLRHLHSHRTFLSSMSFTFKKLLLVLSHFHKLTIFLLGFHRLRQRASIGKSVSFIHHFQVLSHAENSNSALHICCRRAPDSFK